MKRVLILFLFIITLYSLFAVDTMYRHGQSEYSGLAIAIGVLYVTAVFIGLLGASKLSTIFNRLLRHNKPQ